MTATRNARRAAAPGKPPGRWWREMVLYENHLPSLRDASGDGIGDLGGLIASLDYLAQTLGVTAVWVGPFFRSPLLDQGFDVSDHADCRCRCSGRLRISTGSSATRMRGGSG